MSDFPTTIYAPRTKENKTGVVYDPTKTKIAYAEDITKLDDEVVAIETYLKAGVLVPTFFQKQANKDFLS